MIVPVIKPKEKFKCDCGCTKYQVVDWRPLIIICKECCKRLDENEFKIDYKEN